MTTVYERVKAGATFMDLSVPGWAGKVDRDRFDMSLCGGCIIGQLYGHYYAGCEILSLDDEQSIALGFHSSVDVLKDFEGATAEYRQLTPAWLAEIDARLMGEDASIFDETESSPIATVDMPL